MVDWSMGYSAFFIASFVLLLSFSTGAKLTYKPVLNG
jgi:hypothetical protein